jgi:hypothetical protein
MLPQAVVAVVAAVAVVVVALSPRPLMTFKWNRNRRRILA